ncbi:hypothetical protein SAMN06265340_1222 [Desulfurobacterium atlanticum]|uniref:Thioredoxin-like fold domain-containing protein n=1 Tax=Desulfurobacterium atlanticum TaxID=240169 RepID=A0A239AFH1_9BACT|nr:hypothetical protein SAMN06265340_1222 [Desulfurobacterium atlanticum]
MCSPPTGVKVTPTFIFEDGTVIEGAQIKAVENKLANSKNISNIYR